VENPDPARLAPGGADVVTVSEGNLFQRWWNVGRLLRRATRPRLLEEDRPPVDNTPGE
jgi:hypothetical protein